MDVDRYGAAFALVSCPDQGHEEFEGAGECQRRPGADQGTDGTMAETVRQVGTDGGDYPGTEAPARQRWCRVVRATGGEEEHALGQDEPVHGERDEPGSDPSLAMGAHKFVGVTVGDDR